MRVCAWEREMESERVHGCVSVRKRDGVWECVCVCVRERDRERENLAATSVSAQPHRLINSQDSRQENLYLIKCAEERAKRQMFTFWTCWKNSQQIRGHFGGLSRRCEVQTPTYAWFLLKRSTRPWDCVDLSTKMPPHWGFLSFYFWSEKKKSAAKKIWSELQASRQNQFSRRRWPSNVGAIEKNVLPLNLI